MANSLRSEVPKARINITLDVETDGAQKKTELPLKLLVAGDFSRGKTTGPVTKRERININKNNFDKVIADIAPELKFSVPNKIKNDGSDLKIDLNMTSIKNFRPEAVMQQIPELQNLLAMRNLLTDLKANLLDNNEFRRELEKIAKNQTQRKLLQQELSQNANIKEINNDTNI